jgi:homoserine kinase type II
LAGQGRRNDETGMYVALMQLDQLLQSWPIAGPFTVAPASAGINNQTWLVTTPGDTDILQISLNAVDRSTLDAQHRLLALLNRSGLPFAVPSPLPSRNGTTIVAVDNDQPRMASLFRSIPGRAPDTTNMHHVELCAVALRELHTVLEAIADPEPLVCDRRFGAFAIAEPVALLQALDFEPSLASSLVRIFEGLQSLMPVIEATLLYQIIHADFYPSNVLVHDGRVSGILDFEAASLGPRSADLAIALWTFALSRPEETHGWKRAASFLRAYQADDPMDQAELRYLPEFILAREAGSFVHWGGRWREKLTTEHDIRLRALRLKQVHRWVTEHRHRFEDLVRNAS